MSNFFIVYFTFRDWICFSDAFGIFLPVRKGLANWDWYLRFAIRGGGLLTDSNLFYGYFTVYLELSLFYWLSCLGSVDFYCFKGAGDRSFFHLLNSECLLGKYSFLFIFCCWGDGWVENCSVYCLDYNVLLTTWPELVDSFDLTPLELFDVFLKLYPELLFDADRFDELPA